MKPLYRIAWRNVVRNWRHSLSALLSIAAGFASLSLFQAYMLDVENMYVVAHSQRFMYGNFVVEKHGAQDPKADMAEKPLLSKADQAVVEEFLARHADEVEASVRFLSITGMVTNGLTSTIFWGLGHDLEQGAKMRGGDWAWNTIAGKPLYVAGQAEGLVIGEGLGQILDCERLTNERFLNGMGGYAAEDRPFRCARGSVQLNVTTLNGQLNASDAPVVGMLNAAYKEIDTKVVTTSLQHAQKLMDTDAVSYFAVMLKRPGRVPTFMRDLSDFARSKGATLDIARWQDHPFGDLYVRTMSLLGLFRNFVVAVIVTVAGLSVLNTVIKIVKERIREIGTLRSLGFTPKNIVALFVVEASILAGFGCLLGLGLTFLSTWGINSAGILYKAGMLTEPVPFRIAWAPTIYLTSLLFLSLVAILAAIGPSRSAARSRISELLVHT
ncbi:MAG TPA: FtsX-like permease family protein [Bdellovibrionota bacterium]|nr:FtsX-like permease family protein [Bdellovibrionota bacterium]